MIEDGARVAIVDDVPSQAEIARGIAEEAGLIPEVITQSDGPFSEPMQLLDLIVRADCAAAICDHRLYRTGFASFNGAEFAATLYAKRIPTVLLSTFSGQDHDRSIRLYRSKIPSLIAREDLHPDRVKDGLLECERELAGQVSDHRRLYRTLVRVEDVSSDRGTEMVDAIIHTWNPDRAVSFPLALVEDKKLIEMLRNWSPTSKRLPRMFALVNIGCHDESELILQSFEPAPEADDDDF